MSNETIYLISLGVVSIWFAEVFDPMLLLVAKLVKKYTPFVKRHSRRCVATLRRQYRIKVR